MASGEVTRTFLEMTSPGRLRRVPLSDETARVERLDARAMELYRRLYREVGARHHWVDRREWSDERIRLHLADASVQVWTLRVADAVAGYFELVRGEDRSVELAYFGLLPPFIGRGFGGGLLSAAVERAWAWDATRVWLHTCTLDHPAALPNYLARGFVPFRRERHRLEPSVVDGR